MNIIFQIEGSIGKNIAATAVCKAIKKHHPKDKLIVMTAYPDIFLCNPNIDRIYTYNDISYFYNDFVDVREVKLCAHNP